MVKRQIHWSRCEGKAACSVPVSSKSRSLHNTAPCASRQVPAGVPAESRTLTFPLVYTLPSLTGLRDGLAARRRREGDLAKVYAAAPAVPGEPAGAPDLMRDPVELPRRCCLGEAPTVAEGGEKEAAGCVGVCRRVSDRCVVSSESHARCLCAEPAFSSFHFQPRLFLFLFHMHWIPCRTLIMTFNNTAPVPSTQLAFNCKMHICYKIKKWWKLGTGNQCKFSKMLFTTKCSANSFQSVIIRELRYLNVSTLYDQICCISKCLQRLLKPRLHWLDQSLFCVAGWPLQWLSRSRKWNRVKLKQIFFHSLSKKETWKIDNVYFFVLFLFGSWAANTVASGLFAASD